MLLASWIYWNNVTGCSHGSPARRAPAARPRSRTCRRAVRATLRRRSAARPRCTRAGPDAATPDSRGPLVLVGAQRRARLAGARRGHRVRGAARRAPGGRGDRRPRPAARLRRRRRRAVATRARGARARPGAGAAGRRRTRTAGRKRPPALARYAALAEARGAHRRDQRAARAHPRRPGRDGAARSRQGQRGDQPPRHGGGVAGIAPARHADTAPAARHPPGDDGAVLRRLGSRAVGRSAERRRALRPGAGAPARCCRRSSATSAPASPKRSPAPPTSCAKTPRRSTALAEELIEDLAEHAEAGLSLSVRALAANPPALRQRIIRLAVGERVRRVAEPSADARGRAAGHPLARAGSRAPAGR